MKLDKEIIFEFLSENGRCKSDDSINYECIYKDDREIYRVSCNHLNYVYKTIGSNRKSVDEFEIEFKLMTDIWDLSEGKISMPQPLFLIENRGFLMTECLGLTFKEIYYSSLLNFSQRKKVKNKIEMVGKWLGSFHSLTLNKISYIDLYSNRRKNLIRMIDSINSKADITVISIMKKVVDSIDNVNTADEIEVAQLHGNFALRNMIVDSHHVSLIDFEDSKKDCIYYDLGMFVAELMNKSILLFNTVYNNHLIKAFIQSYSSHVRIDKNILNSYILYHLISSYYDVVNREKPISHLKSIFLYYKTNYNLRLIKDVLKSIS